MLIPVEQLIDGVVRTLTDAVLPDVGSRFARGQLYAAIDVLRNLRDRVEEKCGILDAEADSARQALAGSVAALRRAGERAGVARIAGALDAVPAGPPAARAAALRAALAVALEVLDTRPDEAARRAVGAHLAAQAMTDAAPTKPSLLGEISKG